MTTESLPMVPDEMSSWQAMLGQAQVLVRSGFLPKSIKTAEQALAVMQTGKELGIGPMQALRSINVIEGKPTMSAELIAGLVLARIPGAVLRVAETTDKLCVVQAARPGQPVTVFRFSWEDATRAGINSKHNWKTYPAAMLRARCLTAAARAIFPDATMGLYDPDELGAITTEDGKVISIETVIPEHVSQADVQDEIARTSAGLPDKGVDDTTKEAQRVIARAMAAIEKAFPGSPSSREAVVMALFATSTLEAAKEAHGIAGVARTLKEHLVSTIEDVKKEKATPAAPDDGGTALISTARNALWKLVPGEARDAAMTEAFGTTDWAQVETFSLKELEEATRGGRIEKIVEAAIGKGSGELFQKGEK